MYAAFWGIPFLRYVVFWLLRFGVVEVIVTGSDSQNGWLIEEEIRNNCDSRVKYIPEGYPVSTVHSSYLGLSRVSCEHSFLLTGDNIWNVDLSEIVDAHISRDSECTVLVTTQKGVPNLGFVKIENGTMRILSMYDVQNSITGVPASTMGLYLLNTQRILHVTNLKQDVYIERESMAKLIPHVWSVENKGFFFDFGIPEKYRYLLRRPEIVAEYFGIPREQ